MKKKKLIKKLKKDFKKHRQRYAIAFFVVCVGIMLALFVGIRTEVIENEHAAKIDDYFLGHDAPLSGYGSTFVHAANKCDMDWRLLPAIAMQESSGGKRIQYNNPFGWGSAEIPFDSFEEAILHVGNHLCGNVSTTEKWYDTTSTEEKLYWYNGTVAPTYPAEVQWIMEQIGSK